MTYRKPGIVKTWSILSHLFETSPDSNGEWQGIHRPNGKPLRSINGRYGVLLTVLTTWKLKGFPVGDPLRSYIGQRINQAKLLD